jgi:hypothetical protein
MNGPSQLPRAHIPAKLRIETRAARHPAIPQERVTMSASIRRIQGNSAVRDTPSAQFRFWVTRHCTHLSTATSPEKYAKYFAARVTEIAIMNNPIQAI